MRKLIITTTVLMFLFLNLIPINAGKTKGKVKDPGPKSPMISYSLSGNGGTSPSTGVSSAFSINPNAGIEVVWMNFGFGIDASTFSTKSNFDFDVYSAPLKNLDYLSTTNSSNNWRSTSILFGPSYTIPFGLSNPIPGIGIVVKHNYPKATLTLSVKGGVTINQTPDFSVVETNATPAKTIAINNSDSYKKNVLTFKPSIVFAYWLSENFAVNLNANYLIQSSQGEFITKYRDLSKVDFNSTSVDLTKQQITGAPVISSSTKGPDKYMSFGVGITYRFGKKGWDGSIKGNRKGINENGLKKTDNVLPKADIIPITTNFAVGKDFNGLPHDLQNLNKNTGASSGTSERTFNPKDNTGGPSNQVFGYEEAACLELCIQFLDNQGSECDYGSGVCFINIILCGDDIGAITYNGGSHVFVPALSEKLNGLPINVLLQTKTKNGKSLNNKDFNLKKDVELSAEVAKRLNCTKVFIKAGKYKYNENNAVELPINMVGRKGWDGSVKGNITEKGITENGLKINEDIVNNTDVKAIAETLVNRKGIQEGGLNKNEVQKKGINEKGLKKNETATLVQTKVIVESLQNLRKGWDGSVKGNKVEGVANADVKAIAETLVNLTRKGWDGSIKGNKAEYTTSEADVKSIAETMVNIRKGWDGSVKGNKAVYVANEADVKAIAETLVNIRKGWDGSVKGGSKISNVLKTKHDTVKNSVGNIR